MRSRMRSRLVLALVVAVAGSVGFAQAGGEAVYKANCQSCHGSAGTPNPGIAKAMGVKPANDPDYKKASEADMIAAVKNGIRRSTGEYVLIVDADGQHPPEDALRIVSRLGEFDLVIGARSAATQATQARRAGNSALPQWCPRIPVEEP